MKTVLTVFGTRPEAIKLAPVIQALATRARDLRSLVVCTSQHRDLLQPILRRLAVVVDVDLDVMTPGQSPSGILARVLDRLDPVLEQQAPDLVLVQGDTTTTLAGALAAFHRRIPVGHVEAGLRSRDLESPFPEEMNRRVVSQIARLHFAATESNAATLRAEGIRADWIVVTGNPGIDSLQGMLRSGKPSPALLADLAPLEGLKLIVLTTHRRESFGEVMRGHLLALRRFVAEHPDVALVFPVHPNPAVRAAAGEVLAGAERVLRLDPLEYGDFVQLLARAWLLVSDSGGIQEEAPTLARPLLVLRDNTERPEVIECGVGRLVGRSAEKLRAMLDAAWADPTWAEQVRRTPNPFGRGDAGERIAVAIEQHFASVHAHASA